MTNLREQPVRYEGIVVLSDLVDCATDLEDVAGRLEDCAEMLRQMHRRGVTIVDDEDPAVLRLIAPDATVAAAWGMEGPHVVLPTASPR